MCFVGMCQAAKGKGKVSDVRAPSITMEVQMPVSVPLAIQLQTSSSEKLVVRSAVNDVKKTPIAKASKKVVELRTASSRKAAEKIVTAKEQRSKVLGVKKVAKLKTTISPVSGRKRKVRDELEENESAKKKNKVRA